jgi:Leucine-rich repeat (LRR) protein
MKRGMSNASFDHVGEGSAMSLAQCGLADLPAGLDPMLTALDASGNVLTSCQALASLTHLVRLDLSDNQLGPGLGGALASLPSLTALSLERNRLAQLAGELQGCQGLVRLNVGRNRLRSLEGLFPEGEWGGKLQELRLCHAVSGSRRRELPLELWTLTRLTLLDIRFNELRTLPPDVACLTALEVP